MEGWRRDCSRTTRSEPRHAPRAARRQMWPAPLRRLPATAGPGRSVSPRDWPPTREYLSGTVCQPAVRPEATARRNRSSSSGATVLTSASAEPQESSSVTGPMAPRPGGDANVVVAGRCQCAPRSRSRARVSAVTPARRLPATRSVTCPTSSPAWTTGGNRLAGTAGPFQRLHPPASVRPVEARRCGSASEASDTRSPPRAWTTQSATLQRTGSGTTVVAGTPCQLCEGAKGEGDRPVRPEKVWLAEYADQVRRLLFAAACHATQWPALPARRFCPAAPSFRPCSSRPGRPQGRQGPVPAPCLRPGPRRRGFRAGRSPPRWAPGARGSGRCPRPPRRRRLSRRPLWSWWCRRRRPPGALPQARLSAP